MRNISGPSHEEGITQNVRNLAELLLSFSVTYVATTFFACLVVASSLKSCGNHAK
jgi:hypothetical protein